MNQAAHITFAALGLPSGALVAAQVGNAGGIALAVIGVLPLILRELRLALLGVLERTERVAARVAGDDSAHHDFCQRETQHSKSPP